MKNFILIFLLLISIYLNAFFAEENSNYEYLMFYKSLNGEFIIDHYPILRQSKNIDSLSVFEEYFSNLIKWEKNNSEDNKYLISIESRAFYDSLFTEKILMNAVCDYRLNKNIYISISAFVENDSISDKGVKTHIQNFANQDIVGGFDNGYIMYKNNNFLLAFGRMDYHKSFDPYSSLMYDYNTPPIDGIYLSLKLFDDLSYDFKYASLGYTQIDTQTTTYTVFQQYDIMSRFLSFHSINYNIKKNLALSFSEAVVFGRSHFTGFDYMFPFFVFYGEQENMGINDNILWDISILYNYKNIITSSFSLLIDDYQYEKEDIYDYEPPMLGYMLKLFLHNSNGYIGIMHHFVNAWVYNQVYNWNKYEYNNHLLGYENAPDIRDIQLIGNIAINENAGMDFNLGYYIKGDNTINSNWVFPLDSTNMYYYENAYGIEPVEHYFIFKSGINYLYKKINFHIDASYIYSKENINSYNILFSIKTII